MAKWTYDAWGNPTEYNASGTQVAVGTAGNPFLYASYYFDTETSHYYLQARYYDSATGRFLSMDPDPGKATDRLSLNPYIYCSNDAVNSIDPNGHGFWSWAKKAVNTVVNAVRTVVNRVVRAITNVVTRVKEEVREAVGDVGEAIGEAWSAAQEAGAEMARAAEAAAIAEREAAEAAAAARAERAEAFKAEVKKAGQALKRGAEWLGSEEGLATVKKGLLTAGTVVGVAALIVGCVASGGLLAAGLVVAGAGLGVAAGAVSAVQYGKGYISGGEFALDIAGAVMSVGGLGAAAKTLGAVRAAGGLGEALLGEGRAVASGLGGLAKSGASRIRSLVTNLRRGSGETAATGQGFESFDDVKKAVGSPGQDREWHHIVEQSQIKKSGFNPSQIHNTDNLLSLDKGTHHKISGYYSSKDRNLSSTMIVRDWLAGQSFQDQYEFGIDVLKRFGAI
ncbi:MAG: RHS repeat-associated core domain-containing protein [Coriobacteriia bacterium]|nr:RHS repeat-associated core domain-containing protein [Coriobacteriia bacterium]